MKLSRVVLGSAVAVSLVGGSLMAMPVAAQDDCGVTIFGGDVLNETVIDLNANGGTAISDASGGHNNEALTNGGHGGDAAIDIASAGNGGVATASANGGAISTGNINSGGNVGNAISVGDTHCAVMAEEAPAKEKAKEEKAKCVNCGEVHPASYRGCKNFPVKKKPTTPASTENQTKTPTQPTQQVTPGI